MSSDFCAFEEPFYGHHRSNSIPMFNSEALLVGDPFSELSDSSIDSFLQEFSEQPNVNEVQSFDELAHLESLSLCQPTHFTNLQSSADFGNGFIDCSVSGVKLEEAQFQLAGFDSPLVQNVYFQGSEYGGENSMVKFLQRSYSHGSHLYEEQKQGSLFQAPPPPAFSVVSESPENGSFSNGQFGGGQIRRVLSTGDLPVKVKTASSMGNPSVLGSRISTLVDEASFKVGKYSAEEKKERIDRYRAKRSLRNFNKTIKYSCRKTLADSRPRIRGRFARNDEPIERAQSVACFNQYEDDDDHIWVGGLNEGIMQGGIGDQRGGQFVSGFGESAQFDHEFIGLEY